MTGEDFFRQTDTTTGLRRRSVRGGMVTIGGQAAKFVLRLASTAFLGRLLSPEDYGLIAMVAAVTGLVSMFKDLGLATATIQRKEITHEQVSTLFWINIGISTLCSVGIALIAPAIGWFYGEPRLVGITLALALVFIIGGASVQHHALLARQMQFGSIAAIDLGAMFLGIVGAVILAWHGAHYWALVGMTAITELASLVLLWSVSRWVPGPPKRRAGTRSMVTFGGQITMSNLFNYFARNADNILIGWRWGAGPLGIYSRAYQLFMLPIQQINAPLNAVVLPALSRLHSQRESFRRYYLKALFIVSAAAMPISAMIFTFADEIIYVVLGSKWMAVAPVFQVLSIAGILQPMSNTSGWLFLATGRTSLILKWTMIWTAVMLIAFMVGLSRGPLGVAVAYVIARLLMTVPGLIFAVQGTTLRVRDIFEWSMIPFGAALSVILCGLLVKMAIGGEVSRLVVLSFGVLISMLVTGGVLLVPSRSREILKSVLREITPYA